MDRTISALGVFLLLQLTGVLAVALTGSDYSTPAEPRPLLDMAAEDVREVRITGPGEQTVTLARADDGENWRVADPDFPADSTQVQNMLDQLTSMQVSQPVATSEGARDRFRVNAADFERRIVLSDGDRERQLYVGISSDTRSSHVRRQDDPGIYAVDFASYQAPADSGEWLDQSVVQAPRQDITGIEVGEYTLARETASEQDSSSDGGDGNGSADSAGDGGGDSSDGGSPSAPTWRSDSSPEDRSLDGQAASNLMQQLASLQIDGIVSEDALGDYNQEPALSLRVLRGEDDAIRYTLLEHGEEDQYALQTSLREETFSIASNAANRIIDAASESTLFPSPEEAQSQQPTGAGGGPPTAPLAPGQGNAPPSP